jgi:hypothetical protein
VLSFQPEANMIGHKRLSLRLVAAIVTLVLGASLCAVGIVGVFSIADLVSRGVLDDIRVGEIVAVCVLYCGTGAALVSSSLFFWKGRTTVACTLMIIGLLIPAVLFAIMGF